MDGILCGADGRVSASCKNSSSVMFLTLKGKKLCLYIMFRLRYFTIVCNNNEYKMMSQGSSLGQLYNVQNKIKISKKHWLGLRVYCNNLKDGGGCQQTRKQLQINYLGPNSKINWKYFNYSREMMTIRSTKSIRELISDLS
jgi:hypothetical protein